MGITFAGFLAPFIIGMFPWIANNVGEGVTKRVAFELAGKLMEREEMLDSQSVDEKNDAKERPSGNGKDMLSLLMRANKLSNGKGLSKDQILNNVSSVFLSHLWGFRLMIIVAPETQDRDDDVCSILLSFFLYHAHCPSRARMVGHETSSASCTYTDIYTFT